MAEQNWRESPRVVYLADSAWRDQIRAVREKLAAICGQCKNRVVRVETIDGQVYEGTVIGVSGSHLHLAAKNTRFFGPWAASSILTLVLFDLLAITLLL
jgi:hypothetical protein